MFGSCTLELDIYKFHQHPQLVNTSVNIYKLCLFPLLTFGLEFIICLPMTIHIQSSFQHWHGVTNLEPRCKNWDSFWIIKKNFYHPVKFASNYLSYFVTSINCSLPLCINKRAHKFEPYSIVHCLAGQHHEANKNWDGLDTAPGCYIEIWATKCSHLDIKTSINISI